MPPSFAKLVRMYQDGLLCKFDYLAKFSLLFEHESRETDLSFIPTALPLDQLEIIREEVSHSPTDDETWAVCTMLTKHGHLSYARHEFFLSQSQAEYFRFVDTWRRIDPGSVLSRTDTSGNIGDLSEDSSFGSFEEDDITDPGLEYLISKLGTGLFAKLQLIECLVTMFEDSYNRPTLAGFARTLPPQAIAVIREYVEGCPKSSEEWAAFRFGSKRWVRHDADVARDDAAIHFYRFVIAWRQHFSE